MYYVLSKNAQPKGKQNRSKLLMNIFFKGKSKQENTKGLKFRALSPFCKHSHVNAPKPPQCLQFYD